MMPRVFLIHGFEGTPNGGWRPWLMGKLAREDIFACALAMPTPDEPKKDAWVAEIARAVGTPDEQTILVGHSLGVPAILRYLETLDGKKIGGAVLVSGPIQNSSGESAEKMQTFFESSFDFSKILASSRGFAVIHGDTDRSVPYSQAETIARELSCEVVCIPGGGHLNGSSGWYELPQAFDAVRSFIV
jgi:predicted alpha/beta hydrolase family esterase